MNNPNTITYDEVSGELSCSCGNTTSDDGFVSCDEIGQETEPSYASGWTGKYICQSCGATFQMPQTKEDERKMRAFHAIEGAQEAFWAVIAKAFPEAKYGDFGPGETIAFDTACRNAVNHWLYNNAPKLTEYGSYELLMRDIAQALNGLAWNDETLAVAGDEQTGGGIICVTIPVEGIGAWYFGNINDNWGGNLMNDEGEMVHGGFVETTIPSESEDFKAIAEAIYAGLQSCVYEGKVEKNGNSTATWVRAADTTGRLPKDVLVWHRRCDECSSDLQVGEVCDCQEESND